MKNRKLIILAAAIVLGLLSIPALPIIAFTGLSVYGEFDEWRHQTPEKFSERKWNSSLKYRWISIDLLIEEHLRDGMSKEEVVGLLGEPNNTTPEGSFEYEARRPGFHFIDFSGGGLLVEFTPHGYLESATNTTWVD